MGMTLTQARKLSGSLSLAEARQLDPAPDIEAPSAMASVGRGMMDIAQGTKQLYLKGKDAITGSNEELPYTQAVDEENALYEKGRGPDAGVDWGRLAGNTAATLPVALIPGVGSAGVLARTAAGAAQGASASALNFTPEGESKLEQVATGAIAGGALPNVLAGASRVIKPNVRPEVKRLLDEGITPTPGQIMGGRFAVAEDKLTSVPLMGDLIKSGQRRGINDLNVATYKRALEPIGVTPSGKVGREGVAEVSDALSAAYEKLLPKLQFKADAQFGTDLANLTHLTKQLPESQAKQFEKIIKTQLVGKMTPQGNMSGTTLKEVESELSRTAKGYSSDQAFDNRQLGAALNEVVTSMRATLQRSNPDYADELAKINQGYANYARIRAAGASDRAGEGFTPAQLQTAVKSADKTIGKGNFAKGRAQMQDLSDSGAKVLASKYPDSGTAGRSLLGWLALGGAGAVKPLTTVAATAGVLPYTRAGQKITAAMLAKRPEFVTPIADATRKAGGLLNLPLMGLLNGAANADREP